MKEFANKYASVLKGAIVENRRFLLTFTLCLAISILNGYFFNWLNQYLDLEVNHDNVSQLKPATKVFAILIGAPIVETTFFQYLPIKLVQHYSQNKLISIAVSASLFAAIHFYNPVYIMMTFVGGIVLAFFYLYAQQVKKSPFWATALLHALYNLYGFLFVD
jgi:membrane protease YdiL (CAAX protease family)